MKVGCLILVCLLMAVVVVAGCAPAKAPEAEVPAGYESLRLVSTSLGASTNTAFMAYATMLNRHYPEIEWSSCSGTSATHPIYVTTGQIKLALASQGGYVDAYGFDKISESRLRSISLPLTLNQYFFLIPEDKPWKDITEVPKGLTLCPGTPGPTVLCTEAWLNLCGLSKKDFNWIPLSKPEMTDAWRAGKLDLAFTGVSGMAPFLLDMYTSPRKFKPMGLTPEQAAKAIAERTFEPRGFSVAKSNITECAGDVFKYDVICPQTAPMLICRNDFPEAIAYKMAKIFDEHKAELVQIFAAMKYGTPQLHIQWAKPPYDLHAGVAKYYREKGYLK